jgi:GT2 family glycosyltransferase
MVSIVIVSHNAHEYTEACLRSIFLNTKEEYEIILVDNGSDPAILLEENFVHTLIRNDKNMGYPKAANQGMIEAKGDMICLLNNDVIVTPDWLTHLKYHVENGFDVVGAIANVISGPQQTFVAPYTGIEELNKIALEQYQTNEAQCVPFHRIVLFCSLINRKVIDTIGLFDEVFSPGNFEDDDFCFRAIDAGFRCGIAKDVFIHHFGGVTHKNIDIDYKNLINRNKEIMNAKWPPEKYKQMIDKAVGQHECTTEGSLNGEVKIALMTANFGKMDPDFHIQHIKQSSLNGCRLDKYYFTEDTFPLRINAMTPRLQSKIPKMYGWELRPGYDFYLWLDGNITLKRVDSVDWFLSQVKDFDIAIFKHTDHKSIAEETEFVKLLMASGNKHLLSRFMGEPIDEQVGVYLSDSTFKDEHMYSSGAFIYRNTYKMRRALSEWFTHCARYTIHDQLSLPYILNKFDCQVNKIDEFITQNKYVDYHPHRME